MSEAGFGDRVRIRDSPDTASYAGRVGEVFGESIPSSSGVAPVIGDRGDDFAISVHFDETGEQEWFAPHVVEFLDHGGAQTFEIEGGPSFVREADGTWREANGPTELGEILGPGGAVPREIGPTSRRTRAWLRRFRRR